MFLRVCGGSGATVLNDRTTASPSTLDALQRLGVVTVRRAGGREPLYHLTRSGRAARVDEPEYEGGPMPDPQDFDHLGSEVRCIHPACNAGGPNHQWPTAKRQAHLEQSHGGASLSRRPGSSIPGGDNRNGGTTMTKTGTKISGRLACVAVLKAARKPLTANEIATKVVESGIVQGLKGKTPKATLSAQITAGAKKGEVFKKVGSGRPAKFSLAADAPDVPEEILAKLNEAAVAPPIEEVGAPNADADLDAVTPDPKRGKPAAKRSSRSKAKEPVAG